jgi:hypothetical protein
MAVHNDSVSSFGIHAAAFANLILNFDLDLVFSQKIQFVRKIKNITTFIQAHLVKVMYEKVKSDCDVPYIVCDCCT